MSFRTLYLTSPCRLSYKNGYLVIRKDEPLMIHLSEISVILIDSVQISISAYLINEILDRKIKIIFCDERHNPSGEIMPYYGHTSSSKRLETQFFWEPYLKGEVILRIMQSKISNQYYLLKKIKPLTDVDLLKYADEVTWNDETNREGIAAKAYFRALFGNDFTRDECNDINVQLNFGYSVLLSAMNRDITARGYTTQIGLKHHNEFNPFNLSCDLMEPFRPFIDEYVAEHFDETFTKEIRTGLLEVFEKNVYIAGRKEKIKNAIKVYNDKFFKTMETGNLDLLTFPRPL